MNAFSIVITAVLPVVGAVLAGALMRRLNWLTEEADTSLMRITINLFTPCLVLDSILGNRALERFGTLTMAPVIGFCTVAFGIGLGWFVARIIGLQSPQVRRTFALVTGIYNYGYIPLPLAIAFFDKETVGVLFVHNVGVEIALWSVGFLVLTGHTTGDGWRKIINVPLVAIVVALSLNMMGAQNFLPGFVLQTAKLLGQCAIPLGLVLIGAVMADYVHEFHPARDTRVMATACILRLVILPALFLLLIVFLPMAPELRNVVLLQAAMPSAVFPIVMARHYAGDPITALRIVLATSLAALVTIPLCLRLGFSLFGQQLAP